MRLKSLELQGFKSFPDKTVLTFEGGVTAVLGPNGSGKSNISDAVRWVLGELSSRSLRGTKMEDVIFGGSDTRRPMGYAEVTLVLDNTSGHGRLASEYDEVTVTRRYFRSGNSEYLINRKPVRLRDISELFLNTGVGRSGYSIIGQGKIAEIVSPKSEDRRHIFEEAAGISKYRYQKAESERDLAQVDENCRNLSGILGELEKRVNRLERESEKARIYLDIFGEKKQVDVMLWIEQVDTLRADYEKAQKDYVSAKLSLDAADSENAELDAKNERLFAQLQEVKIALDQTEEALRSIRDRGRDLESESRVLANDVLHLGELKTRTETDKKLKTEAAAVQEKTAEEAKAKKEEQIASRRALLDEQVQNGADSEVLRAGLKQTEQDMQACEKKQSEKADGITVLRVRLSALEASHQTDGKRKNGIEGELDGLKKDNALLEGRIGKAEKTVAEYEEKIALEEKTISELEKQSESLRAENESCRSRQNRAQVDWSTKKQRIDSLKRMDELFEGFAHSVRFVMNAAEHGELDGICGPVSRLISVEEQYSLAIETALGANVQNIVVESDADAKAAIAHLKRNGAGRCTFYPISTVRAQEQRIGQELSRFAGYIGVASDLCGYEEKYRAVISSMLGRTAIFSDLDRANDAAKKTSYRFRIVTLDGQVINAGGSFTGGSVKQNSGILTRTAEIERLTAELEALGKERDALAKEYKERADRAAALRAEEDEHTPMKNLYSTLYQAEKTQLEVLRSQHGITAQRIRDLSSDLAMLGKQSENYDETHASLAGELEKAEKELEEIRADAERLAREYGEKDDRLQDLYARHNELLVTQTALEKDIEATEASIGFALSSVQSLHEQIEKDEELIASTEAKQEECRKKIAENEETSLGIGSEETELDRTHKEQIAKSLTLDKQLNDLREQMREKQHSRELIFREYTRLEGSVEQMKEETDRLAARMWEEYELTYSAARELGYPAVTDETRTHLNARKEELRLQLKKLGSVNPESIEEYVTVKDEFDFKSAQYNDLVTARENLTSIVTRLEKDMKVQFLEAIKSIGDNFKDIFRELFGGGTAEIRLTDPENCLECPIEINAAPPGKIVKSMTLLSGGEQSFTAIALIFAILKVNPTPFCIFDEIEAALDEVNVLHFAEYMHRYSDNTQFLVITHRRGTMESADMIYGVSMPEKGISKVLGMNVNEVEAKIGVQLK